MVHSFSIMKSLNTLSFENILLPRCFSVFKESERRRVQFWGSCARVCTQEALPPLHLYPHPAGCRLAGLVSAFRLHSRKWIQGSVFVLFLRFLYGLNSKMLALVRWLNAYSILTLGFHKEIKYFVCYSPQVLCVYLNHAFSVMTPYDSHSPTISSPSTLQTFLEFCWLITSCLSHCIFISQTDKLCQTDLLLPPPHSHCAGQHIACLIQEAFPPWERKPGAWLLVPGSQH